MRKNKRLELIFSFWYKGAKVKFNRHHKGAYFVTYRQNEYGISPLQWGHFIADLDKKPISKEQKDAEIIKMITGMIDAENTSSVSTLELST